LGVGKQLLYDKLRRFACANYQYRFSSVMAAPTRLAGAHGSGE
jgi:hypothetical protein